MDNNSKENTKVPNLDKSAEIIEGHSEYEADGREVIFDLRNVSYNYPTGPIKEGKPNLVLENINMKIFKGERVVILGPNGGGKTTLLKILDGLIRIKQGQISAFEFDLSKDINNKKKMFKFRRKVGFVFQNPDEELFSSTVYEDIIFGPLYLGLDEDEIKARAEEVMKLLNIEHLKNKHPYNLSGGEKKKAAIASVLSIKPEVILFDEPTTGLDPKSRNELIRIINTLNKEGKTIIIATHDVNAIPDIADRVYVLNKRIIASGTTREIFSNIDLLKKTNLEIPEILKLFKVLNAFGYNCKDLPLSIDEAIEQLTRTIETEGGHIHLHIHKHTHQNLKNLKDSFNHEHTHEELSTDELKKGS